MDRAVWTSWRGSGRDPYEPPHNSCSPNLRKLNELLKDRFGLPDKGCHHDRPMRRSSLPSVHSWGAAKDNGATDGTSTIPDVRQRLDRAIEFLLWVSPRAGVQQIHDYSNNRVWKSNRDLDVYPSGWKQQNGLGAMGSSWAMYLHAEVNLPFFFETPDYESLYEEWTTGATPAPLPPRYPIEMIDMSRWNTVVDWEIIPYVPLVHQTMIVHGVTTATPDPLLAERMPRVSRHHRIFGGYLPLVADIPGMMEMHIDLMRPFWRDGAFTQIDIEKWRNHVLPTLQDVIAAVELHDRAFGKNRYCFYINPYTDRDLYYQLLSHFPDSVFWIPGYRQDESEKLEEFQPAIHQWSDEEIPPGFSGPVPVNQVLRPDRLRHISTNRSIEEESKTMQGNYVAHKPVRIFNETVNHYNPSNSVGANNRVGPAENTPDEALALCLVITAVNPTGPGHVNVWSGEGEPNSVSMVNYHPDDASPKNGYIVVGRKGRGFSFRVQGGDPNNNVRVIFEQVGYIMPAVSGGPVEPHDHDDRYSQRGHSHSDYAKVGHDHPKLARADHTHNAETTVGPPL